MLISDFGIPPLLALPLERRLPRQRGDQSVVAVHVHAPRSGRYPQPWVVAGQLLNQIARVSAQRAPAALRLVVTHNRSIRDGISVASRDDSSPGSDRHIRRILCSKDLPVVRIGERKAGALVQAEPFGRARHVQRGRLLRRRGLLRRGAARIRLADAGTCANEGAPGGCRA